MTPITVKLCDELLAKVREAVAQLPSPTQDDDWNQCRINWLGHFALATNGLRSIKADLTSFAAYGGRPNRIITADHKKIINNSQSLLAEFNNAAAVGFDKHNLN